MKMMGTVQATYTKHNEIPITKMNEKRRENKREKVNSDDSVNINKHLVMW